MIRMIGEEEREGGGGSKEYRCAEKLNPGLIKHHRSLNRDLEKSHLFSIHAR